MEIPEKNFIIYDGACGFCKDSVETLKKLLGDKLAYIPYQDLPDNFYEISEKSFAESLKFFEHSKQPQAKTHFERIKRYSRYEEHADAVIYHGAYAVYKAMAVKPQWSWFLFLYLYLPFFGVISEAVYTVIARNRSDIACSALKPKT